MPNLEMVEYWRETEGEEQYNASGNTLTFDPNPRSFKKDVKVTWRIRRPGLERKIERGRFRYNEEIGFELVGSCNDDKRNEIEFYSKRDSLFRIDNFPMPTPHSQYTSDSSAASPLNWDPENYVAENVYVIFESVNFTYSEARIDWFDYSIRLKRVHETRH